MSENSVNLYVSKRRNEARAGKRTRPTEGLIQAKHLRGIEKLVVNKLHALTIEFSTKTLYTNCSTLRFYQGVGNTFSTS